MTWVVQEPGGQNIKRVETPQYTEHPGHLKSLTFVSFIFSDDEYQQIYPTYEKLAPKSSKLQAWHKD